MDEQASRDGRPWAVALVALAGAAAATAAWFSDVRADDLFTQSYETAATAPEKASRKVSVHGSMTLIRPDRTTLGGESAATLVAARNEFESFQVAVEGGRGRDDVRVSLAGEGLRGPDGAAVAGENVTIYREAAYHVEFASDGEGEPGEWYDALIPERDAFYGEDRNAFPYDIPRNGKLVAWVDVFVPPATRPGVYTGALEVTEDRGNTRLATVPVRLTVIDYTMPSTSRLRSLVLSTNEYEPEAPCLAHDGASCPAGTERGWLLHHLYSRAGLENRLTVANPSPVRSPDPGDPAQRRLFDRFMTPLVDGAPAVPEGTGLRDARLQRARLTTVWDGLHQECREPCLDDWRELLGTSGFADRFVFYLCDEPHDEAEYWAECAGRAAQAGDDVPLLVTARLDEAAGAGATGYVDILVPNERAIASEDGGDTRPSYDAFLAEVPGRELWLYTSCESHGCGTEETCSSPEDSSSDTDGLPGYMIDQPPSQARAMGWLAYEYDVTGELYYSATWSLDAAWTNQCVFGGNGEGNLFYPGRPEGYPGSVDSVIGGTTDIPIESLRLKRIRDGREDYEYLRELNSRNMGDRAWEIAAGLLGDPATAVRGATFAQEELDRARCELGALLDPSLRDCP